MGISCVTDQYQFAVTYFHSKKTNRKHFYGSVCKHELFTLACIGNIMNRLCFQHRQLVQYTDVLVTNACMLDAMQNCNATLVIHVLQN